MLSPSSINQRFSLLLLGLVACTSPPRSADTVPPQNARCYAAASLIWPFGEDSTRARRPGAWVALRPEPAGNDPDIRRAAAIDTLGNTTAGSWYTRGADSVAISLANPFDSVTLFVETADSLLQGYANGATDELVQVAPGTYAPRTVTWRVRLWVVPCGTVPKGLWALPRAA